MHTVLHMYAVIFLEVWSAFIRLLFSCLSDFVLFCQSCVVVGVTSWTLLWCLLINHCTASGTCEMALFLFRSDIDYMLVLMVTWNLKFLLKFVAFVLPSLVPAVAE